MPKLASYPPEFLALYLAAARGEETILRLATKQEATNFRHRLHNFRRDAEAEGHPLSATLYSVELVIRHEPPPLAPTANEDLTQEDRRWLLIARIKDQDLISSLHAAGIKPSAETGAQADTQAPRAETVLTQFLKPKPKEPS